MAPQRERPEAIRAVIYALGVVWNSLPLVLLPQHQSGSFLFAALFVLQAVLFAWLGVRSRAHFVVELRPRGILSGALVGYGLVYPLLSLAFGLHYPRLPLFAVPCPTTLVTAGFLLTATGVPRFIGAVPVVWAVIGSSAAIALGIRADLALAVAGALLGLDILLPTALGSTPD